MIKLQVIGHLGRDAIVNNVNGKSVVNFTVAHSEKYKDAQGVQKDRTIWVDCAYWTDRTAIAPYLKKGTQVFAEGNPDIRNYSTQDGRTGSTLTMRVANIQLLGGRQNEGGGAYESGAATSQSAAPAATYAATPSVATSNNDSLDDLPF